MPSTPEQMRLVPYLTRVYDMWVPRRDSSYATADTTHVIHRLTTEAADSMEAFFGPGDEGEAMLTDDERSELDRIAKKLQGNWAEEVLSDTAKWTGEGHAQTYLQRILGPGMLLAAPAPGIEHVEGVPVSRAANSGPNSETTRRHAGRFTAAQTRGIPDQTFRTKPEPQANVSGRLPVLVVEAKSKANVHLGQETKETLPWLVPDELVKEVARKLGKYKVGKNTKPSDPPSAFEQVCCFQPSESFECGRDYLVTELTTQPKQWKLSSYVLTTALLNVHDVNKIL